MDNTSILSVNNISYTFGGLKALDGVSIDVKKGEILCIIGPNGAGKTTLFNCITGFLKPTTGSIFYDGSIELTGQKPHKIASYGIYRSFQNLALFSNLTVLENVVIGGMKRKEFSYSIYDAMLKTKTFIENEKALKQEALEILNFVGIVEKRNVIANQLSYGERKLLELARGLITRAKLLLLDEPAAGLNPTEKVELANAIRKIQEQHIDIVLIEHDMKFVSDIANWIVVLDYGKKLAEGLPQDIKNNKAVIEAYLGRELTNQKNAFWK
ncbi:MAG: ABC transporter ATP-binding protein [bacterium]